MDGAYIQVLADGTHDFDMGIGVIAAPRILARLTKEQVKMIRGFQRANAD